MFFERLKELREERNLNQTDLAKHLNISQGTIGNWETNKRVPDVKMILKIADYFDVSVDYLLGKTNERRKTVPNEKSLSEKQQEIIDIVVKLSEDDIKRVLEYAELLKYRQDS